MFFKVSDFGSNQGQIPKQKQYKVVTGSYLRQYSDLDDAS